MAIVTAHYGADCLQQAVESWVGKRISSVEGMCPPDLIVNENDLQVYITSGRHGMLPAFQHGFGATGEFEIIAFFHDDLLTLNPDWKERVLAEFEDPKVGLVGFGGGLGWGDLAIYQKPYAYQQLARTDFLSNMVDAENHGRRFTGSCDVAVLDGFALIFRRTFLEQMGGWQLDPSISYIGYDYAACLAAHKLGWKIRLAGVPVQHLGGRTFVALGIGKDPKHWQQYLDAHATIYEQGRGILPVRVTG